MDVLQEVLSWLPYEDQYRFTLVSRLYAKSLWKLRENPSFWYKCCQRYNRPDLLPDPSFTGVEGEFWYYLVSTTNGVHYAIDNNSPIFSPSVFAKSIKLLPKLSRGTLSDMLMKIIEAGGAVEDIKAITDRSAIGPNIAPFTLRAIASRNAPAYYYLNSLAPFTRVTVGASDIRKLNSGSIAFLISVNNEWLDELSIRGRVGDASLPQATRDLLIEEILSAPNTASISALYLEVLAHRTIEALTRTAELIGYLDRYEVANAIFRRLYSVVISDAKFDVLIRLVDTVVLIRLRAALTATKGITADRMKMIDTRLAGDGI